jgi:hypothetical protein
VISVACGVGPGRYIAAREGEGEGDTDNQKEKKERAPEFIVTIGEHRQLVGSLIRDPEKRKDEI